VKDLIILILAWADFLLLILLIAFLARAEEPEAKTEPQPARNPEGKEEALAAVQHILEHIRDDSTAGYYLGTATQSFEMLCRAYGKLTGKDSADIEEVYTPQNAKKPAEGATDSACSIDLTEDIDRCDIIDAMEGFANITRMELLRELQAKFCDRCGGFSPAGLGCECNIGRTPMLPNGRPAFAVV
jgi:hypothetical protein